MKSKEKKSFKGKEFRIFDLDGDYILIGQEK
jgi:hypothetical protein